MNIYTFTYNTISVDYVSVIAYTSNKKLNAGGKYFVINYSEYDTFYTGLIRFPPSYNVL